MSRIQQWKVAIVGLAVFVAGLALGAGKSAEDDSAANTASKLLLPLGLLLLVVGVVLAVRAGRRVQRRR